MKLKYYLKTNPAIWCILESEVMGPKWSVIDCYDKACLGMTFKDLNEFMQIHLGFVEDESYRMNQIRGTEKLYEYFNNIPSKPKECNHKFILYVGIVETYKFCVHCNTKKVA